LRNITKAIILCQGEKIAKSNPSVMKDKCFVEYVTQGPAAGALETQP